ncbi:MAG: GTP-binding protein [Pseudomonadota bacterium]
MENWFEDGQSPRLPISILTGFLGSGKTTVLNHLVRQADMRRTLILINEFGEIGLDHDLMVHSSDDDVVVEMSSGCLCCSIRGDLVRTLRQAPGRFARGGVRWFDQVIIETTGLADPAPILHTLMTDRRIAQLYRLENVITTIDAVNADATLDDQMEAVKQAAMADQLVITKTDLADPDAVQHLQTRLKALNPAAPQTQAHNGAVDADVLFGNDLYDPKTKTTDVEAWLNAEAYQTAHDDHDHDHGHQTHSHSHSHHDDDHEHHHDVNRHDAHIKALCLTIDEPIYSEALEHWLKALLMFRGKDLLRIKGIINVAEFDGPVVVHGVQHIFHPATKLDKWPSDDHRTRIVFITRDVDEASLRRTLDKLQTAVAQDKEAKARPKVNAPSGG